ncbi:MAG: shikimate kinase [Luteolibacter sp.]|jgi:shikimate kinase
MNRPDPPPKNLVLIGFMGCGKSTVGRELHRRLNYPLIDTDHEIEARTGKTIREIFEGAGGELEFREMETELLRELAETSIDGTRRIISTGGGICGREENRTLLRRLGYVVWLHAPLDVILERTSKNQDRPLLDTEDPSGKVHTLMQQREPLYREVSHLDIDTTGLDFKEISVGILESARYYFTGHP